MSKMPAARSIGCFAETTARHRLYKRIHLFDPAVELGAGVPNTSLGATRLGMPAFWAELTVELTGVRSRYMSDRFIGGFTCATDKRKFHQLMGALGKYKLARDKILATAANHQIASAGESRIAGQFTAGQFIRRRT